MRDHCQLSFLFPAYRFRVSSRVSAFYDIPKWRACSQARFKCWEKGVGLECSSDAPQSFNGDGAWSPQCATVCHVFFAFNKMDKGLDLQFEGSCIHHFSLVKVKVKVQLAQWGGTHLYDLYKGYPPLAVSDVAKFGSNDWLRTNKELQNYFMDVCMVGDKLVPQPTQREQGQYLLNMFFLLLTTVPHYSLFCGQLYIDPVLVTFAQM